MANLPNDSLVYYDSGLVKRMPAGDNIVITGGITAATFSGSGASLTSLDAGNISSGTLNDARLSANVALLNAASNTFTGSITASSFSGSGASLTSLDAGAISTGSLDDARLSANVLLKNAASNTLTGNLTVNGNLNVKGDVISGGEVNVVLTDSFLDLNGGNLLGTAKTGGLAVNVLSALNAGTAFSSVSFTARSGSTNPEFVVSGNAPWNDGDIIQISGSTSGANDGQYIVKSATYSAPNTTVVVYGSSAAAFTAPSYVPFAHTDFASGADTAAKVTPISVGALAVSDGSSLTDSAGNAIQVGDWCFAYGDQASDFTTGGSAWVSVRPASAPSLQTVYNASSPAQILLEDAKPLTIEPAMGATAGFSIIGSSASTVSAGGNELTLGGAGGSVAFATKTKLPTDGRTVVAFAGNALPTYALAYYDATGNYVAASSAVACTPVGTAFDSESFSCVPGTFIRALGKTGSAWATGATLWMSDEAGKIDDVPPTTGRVFIVGVALAPYDQTLDSYADIRFQPQYVIDLP